MTQQTNSPSILKRLRALTPPSRDCTFDEALNIAERQATTLGRFVVKLDPGSDGIGLRHIDGLPRVRVVFEQLPVSGMSHWNGREWIVAIASGDSPARQRFTLLHEFKHIVDHGQASRLYAGDPAKTPYQQAEAAADYFAGCALVPRSELKSAWGHGIQRLPQLADHFGVSHQAIEVRLDQTGLSREVDPEPVVSRARCARPVRTPRWQRQRFTTARSSYISRRCA